MTGTDAGAVQRTHILDQALALMSERGAHDTSMRRLAAACGLNVATLYHYFPSKADLLRAVIEDRRYLELLEADQPVVDPEAAPVERLAGMLEWLFTAATAEEPLMRLVLGESLRGDEVAVETVGHLVDAMDQAFARWWAEHFADVDRDPATVARLVRAQVIAVLVQAIVQPEPESPADRGRWARELAELVVG